MQLLTLSSFFMEEFYNRLRVVIRVLWLFTTVEQRWSSQKHQPHDLITTNEQHHDGVRCCNR